MTVSSGKSSAATLVLIHLRQQPGHYFYELDGRITEGHAVFLPDGRDGELIRRLQEGLSP